MASERDLELLDNYIGNRMTAQERVDFEQKLTADAELKGEFDFQQRIAEGIRQARATELKAMLKKVPLTAIPPSETTMLLTKWGGWAVAAGLIIAGVYLYFNAGYTDSKPHLESATTKITPQIQTPSETTPAEPSAPQQEPSAAATTEQENPQQEDKKTDSSKPAVDDEKAVEPTLDVFDPSEEMSINPSEPSTKIEGTTRIAASSSITVETDSDNKKYTFHYQFKDGKLLLLGSFEKNLYEIMEFFAENKRTIFLFYKNNYYLLREENEKVTPLTPITDPALLKKLREYRKK